MGNEKNMNDYYQTCAFPKPKTTKTKKLENGWKDKPNRICWYCGARNAERHEIYNGPYRQTSIQMGFQVDVCSTCHRRLHEVGRPFGKIETMKWKMYYQKQYEDKLIESGIKKEQARDCWMTLIGRNYL